LFTQSLTSLLFFHTIGFFKAQTEKADIPTRTLATTSDSLSHARSAQEIDELEEKLRQHEGRITEMNTSYETLQRRYLQLAELRHVLRDTGVFFQQVTSSWGLLLYTLG
jgi:V-type H+-transporting ATPase subunit a